MSAAEIVDHIERLQRENAELRKVLTDLLDDKATTYAVRVSRARATLARLKS